MMNRSFVAVTRALRSQPSRRAVHSISHFTRSRKSTFPILPRFHISSRLPVLGGCSQTRSFSISLKTSFPSGTVDEELAAKLTSEISVEKELGDYNEIPDNLKEFLETSQFKLDDKPGLEEVELIRRFGDETIRVVFSIADLNAVDEKIDDASLYDQEEAPELPDDGETSPKKPGDKESKAAQSTEDEEQEYDEAGEPAYPVRLNITIEKSASGALQVEAVAQDGMILIENVHYHQSAELATAQSAEADWERRGHYVGPPFGNLDEDLQVLLERYLDERGINTALALFVPDYIDYKEQKEYMAWLNNVQSFVQA